MLGCPIHREAATVIERLGGVTSDFKATQLSSKIAASADLIVVMTKAHRDAVLELAPRQLKRTYTLNEAAYLASQCDTPSISEIAKLRPKSAVQKMEDIADPIGQTAEVFAAVGAQIAGLLPAVLEICRAPY